MEHPLLGGDGSGSLFPSSSVAILELDHRLPPSTPVQPMSLFGDDDGVAVDEDGASREFLSPEGGGDHASKGCSFLWQRMKWTDDVVRLLISVVASVGDDTYAIDSVVNASSVVELSRKANAALQKKGKWKMVSKLMMQNRCYVSPQQCEDKFNDLNKRYKRLNEILGRGTCCQVVENPALLDSMSHISQKVKDDVRRILSSKHLFYREMCAYHNGQRVPDSFCGMFILLTSRKKCFRRMRLLMNLRTRKRRMMDKMRVMG
ncbi:hypothetical protein HPP92_020518 [Vanilla planifolia]|uniref:Myb/SANT-like DNA-binding domain-containing protein n=1 Tax=Vanilla planifolia TaxID=51239 RepID=A0A835Q2H6_VANPL|nr:hypothetical protein HPP92_020518 [Vanilla planifolia]